MDNQHRQIKGYRELEPQEIDKMNKIKAYGMSLGVLIAEMRLIQTSTSVGSASAPLICKQV